MPPESPLTDVTHAPLSQTPSIISRRTCLTTGTHIGGLWPAFRLRMVSCKALDPGAKVTWIAAKGTLREAACATASVLAGRSVCGIRTSLEYVVHGALGRARIWRCGDGRRRFQDGLQAHPAPKGVRAAGHERPGDGGPQGQAQVPVHGWRVLWVTSAVAGLEIISKERRLSSRWRLW
jgi:hypothetical protein